jgi:carbamoylphosphate synthase large subunit
VLGVDGTCGVDVAVVRGSTGELQVRVMEVNARTTMSHYAIAAKRRVARAVRFEVLRLSELEAIMGGTGANRDDILCLTDPETASTFCAVLHLQSQPAPTR